MGIVECIISDVFSPWRAYEDVPMPFRGIDDRGCNSPNATRLFQFLVQGRLVN